MSTGEIRPFMETLGNLREGRTIDDLAYELNQVIEGVRNHGRAGELKLTLKITPANKGDGDVVMIADDITSKVPKERPSTLFFTTADNNLSRSNPRQSEMELKPVAERAKEQTS